MVGGPKGDPGAVLVEDEVSFAAPLRQVIADCITAFKQASRTVKGAEARVSAALADLKALTVFTDEIARLMEERGFHSLPEFKQGRVHFDGYHHLTVAPWCGIFLVSRDGADVVALIFSRLPLALEERIAELAAGYRAAKPAADDEEDPGGR